MRLGNRAELVGAAAKGMLDIENRAAVAVIGAGNRAVVRDRDQSRAEIDKSKNRLRRQPIERLERGVAGA